MPRTSLPVSAEGTNTTIGNSHWCWDFSENWNDKKAKEDKAAMIYLALRIPERINLSSSWANSSLVRSLDHSLQDACLAYEGFDRAMEGAELIGRAIYEAHIKEHMEMRESMGKDYSNPPLLSEVTIEWINSQFAKQEIEYEFQKRQREIDNILDWRPHRASLLYARSFLYSLDRISQVLTVLSKEGPHIAEFKSAIQEFSVNFPKLHDHRNSSAHIEDRLRGLGPRGTPIAISFMFITESLLSDRTYQNTLSDGSLGSVEISIETLLMARDILQKAFNEIEEAL